MSDLRDDKTETGCDLRTALEAERAAVGVGSSRIKHINSRLAAMHTPEVIASLQHRAMEIESPSGPTPPDATAQREAIALWPNGCRAPGSCSRHRSCMYTVCKHNQRDISGEVDFALQTRAGG